jgi:hypothetical protein
MAVEVSLNTSASPPVTVNPQIHDVNQGNQTIKWKPASHQSFAFSSLSIDGNPSCFGTPDVSVSEITVTDNNPGADAYYAYTIKVTSNGVTYSSALSRPNPTAQSSGPTIHNK